MEKVEEIEQIFFVWKPQRDVDLCSRKKSLMTNRFLKKANLIFLQLDLTLNCEYAQFFALSLAQFLCSNPHWRRVEREAKAKVVASDWGAEFIQFLAALTVLPRSIWKKWLNSFYSFPSWYNRKQLWFRYDVMMWCDVMMWFRYYFFQ